jgi:hypothetical protein
MLKKAVFLLILVVIFPACSKKEVKPPSQDSKTALEAFELAEGMRKAYVERTFRDLMQYCTEEAYDGIIRDIKKFRSVDLAFTPRWVEMEGETVLLNVSWKGRWAMEEGGVREAQGMAVFELKGKPLKLTRILRDNPFSQPEAP